MKLITLLISIILFSCSPAHTFKKDRAAFESSKVLMSFKSIADLNDSCFVIKENNFFEFYKLLYDSVKNTSFPGKYTSNGDTMLLQFYNKKGMEMLGHKAWIDTKNKTIIFFNNLPGIKASGISL